jgi:RNA polymerase sigma-70 factor (ECF subfamily)
MTTESEPQVLHWVEELQRGRSIEINSQRIFKRYYRWVRSFFMRRHVPLERAEELSQDTFFQLFQRIQSFRGEGTFESWLFAITANLLRYERRRLGRQKRDAPEVPIESPHPTTGAHFEIADGDELPAEAAYKSERLRALDRAIDRLPERAQECIRLRLAGNDYPEIAEILRLKASTARVHVFTARQRLQKEFGEEFAGWSE